MFKKLASSLILGSLLVSSAFAGDFLAKISNGALSDNSQGVKALNLDEMKQVKGGYLVGFINIGNNEIGALANSNAVLNNNIIIKELAGKYKEQMESALGGWYPRR
ncbi:hypothetical protein KHD03_001836 [Campylobacter coli]|nr:hypothetical protein [Campylobacter coli]